MTLSSGTISGTTGNTLTSGSAYDVRSGAVSAILGGSVGLNKTTGGTVTLLAANTYGGVTTVSEGTLALSGSGRIASSSVISIASGATLDVTGLFSGLQLAANQILKGTGEVTGAVTIGAGGIIAPGNSPGITTINGNFTLNGIYEAELGGTIAGDEYDQILVYGGDVVLGLGSVIKLVPYPLIGGFTPTAGDTFTLIDWDSGKSFTDLGYTVDTSLFGPSSEWLFSQVGSSFQAQYNGTPPAVPEPSSAAVSGLALALLALLKRMRRKKELRPAVL